MATILVVDDSVSVRRSLRRVLEAEGHQINEAGNGAEALVAMRCRCFDLALVDIMMPYVHGVELMEQIRGLKPTPKIVAMSALGAAWICPDGIQIDARLHKPFAVAELKSAVRRTLN